MSYVYWSFSVWIQFVLLLQNLWSQHFPQKGVNKLVAGEMNKFGF